MPTADQVTPELRNNLILASAYFHAPPPGEFVTANCHRVLVNALIAAGLWDGELQRASPSALENHDPEPDDNAAAFAIFAQWYESLIQLTRQEPESRRLLQGSGNLGTPDTPGIVDAAGARFTACTLTPLGKAAAVAFLSAHPNVEASLTDLARTREWIAARLSSSPLLVGERHPISTAMAALIDRSAANNPHPAWSHLRLLPYDDLSPLFAWLECLFRKEPPTTPLEGIWFQPINHFNHQPGGQADLRLSGTRHLAPDPQKIRSMDYMDWFPDGRNAGSAVMAEISRLVYQPGTQDSLASGQPNCLGGNAEWVLCLGYAAFAVRELMERIDPPLRRLLLGKADSLNVGAGYDHRTFVHLGKLGPTGFA